MKKLPVIRATSEQLHLISQNRLGIEVICGAAGSGKTSTALLRLKSLIHMHLARHERLNNVEPVKILVLTFNRTLAGYVSALVENQIKENANNVELEVSTFAKWSWEKLGRPNISDRATDDLQKFAQCFSGMDTGYACKEAEYAMGRFLPKDLDKYITVERTGRSLKPRVERTLRRRLLDEVILPYQKQLLRNDVLDWNLLAVSVSDLESIGYEIVIVDESQDFSANQLRAIQHRNTSQIARFAAGILRGVNIDGDGALPNLTATESTGTLPVVIRGCYSQQLSFALNYIREHVDLNEESVAFLKPKGGRWFDEIRRSLKTEDIGFVDITRESE